jgi:hypothetical protein
MNFYPPFFYSRGAWFDVARTGPTFTADSTFDLMNPLFTRALPSLRQCLEGFVRPLHLKYSNDAKDVIAAL